MDSRTSKVQLRARIRSARTDRSIAEAGPGSPSDLTDGQAQASPAEAGSGSSASVADAAWNVIDSHPVRTLLAYAALSGEPNLDPAIDRFLAAGGTVYLPVVTKVGEPLAFGQVIGSMSSLEPQGKWGIREPQDSSQPLSADELLSPEIGLDLIFVPALGFGADGARLGNGGGFYDRTFGPQGAAPLGSASPEHVSSSADHDESTPPTHGSASPTDGPRVVGVCFAEELALPGLVAEDWDLRIPAAVTENGLHTFATS